MTALDVTIPVLREWWGAHYEIGWDFQAGVYRALRRDSGAVLTDPEPETLWSKIREDFARNATPARRPSIREARNPRVDD